MQYGSSKGVEEFSTLGKFSGKSDLSSLSWSTLAWPSQAPSGPHQAHPKASGTTECGPHLLKDQVSIQHVVIILTP